MIILLLEVKFLVWQAAEYNAGGSDKVVNIIECMDDAELKKWLTDIVRKDMGLGVKIIINKEA